MYCNAVVEWRVERLDKAHKRLKYKAVQVWETYRKVVIESGPVEGGALASVHSEGVDAACQEAGHNWRVTEEGGADQRSDTLPVASLRISACFQKRLPPPRMQTSKKKKTPTSPQ